MFHRTSQMVMVGALLGSGLAIGGLGVTAAGATARSSATSCSPASFDDTDGVVALIDRTVSAEMKHVEAAFKAAHLAPGGSSVRQATLTNGVIAQVTLNRTADGTTYSFELDMAQPGGTPDFVLITDGSRTDEGVVNGVHTVGKQVFTDYDALATFEATSQTGHFSASMEDVTDPSKPGKGEKDTRTVNFSGITVKAGDPHGPRTGTYVLTEEQGLGGSLDFQASIPVPCPANPTGPVQISVQRQHVNATSTEVDFRRDASVTGASLASGQQSIGFSCGTAAQVALGVTLVPRTSYSLHKIENADGTTQTFSIKYKNETAPNCNAVFGSLVSPTDNSSDWTFPEPLSFPGEW